VAGLLRAEGPFRRIKGHRAMLGLIKALEIMTRGKPPKGVRNVNCAVL
jgi:hypothetical protein